MIALLRMDALRLRRDRLALGVLAAGLVACLLAVVAGHARLTQLTTDRTVVANEAATARQEAGDAWTKAATIPAEDAALLPSRLATTLLLAPPTLVDFSAGRAALEPIAATARLSTRPDALFARYQVGNAEAAARGGIDLSFVAVVLAPLLLIGLGYGVFSADRESGVARLWLAQAGSPLKLLAARGVNRLALVFAPILLAGVTLLLLGPGDRAGPIVVWLALALLGLLFWWSVVLLVNSFAAAAETAALTLVGTWAVFVFVVPAAIGAAAALINPPPSHFEQIAVARAAEVRANREYDDDHPELSSVTLAGRRASVLKGIEVRQSVAVALAPLVRVRDAEAAAQKRFTRRLALLSPAIVTADALTATAHTDAAFYARQRESAAGHLAPLSTALADAALGRRPVDRATLDALPIFTPPAAPSTPVLPILWLALLTLLLTGWATFRFRQIRPL